MKISTFLFLVASASLAGCQTVPNFDPVSWKAPAFDPGAWQETTAFSDQQRLELPGEGPEDLDVDEEGRVYVGVADGRILRVDAHGKAVTWANTGGRPLGMDWDAKGNLIVADGEKGLLRVNKRGEVETLTQQCQGKDLTFTNDLEVAPSGKIYFTDASNAQGPPGWKPQLLENRPRGRLCVFDPLTAKAELLVGGLYYGNGVAVGPDESFVLVVETARYRVRKIELHKGKVFRNTVLIDNLPGFPDGLSSSPKGDLFWMAIASPRNGLVDRLSKSPGLRTLVVALPDALQPAPQITARALAIDARGQVVHDLFDPKGEKIRVVTSVQERKGKLYLGSLTDTAYATARVP
jgi:sugar lactone lactonase YvrE